MTRSIAGNSPDVRPPTRVEKRAYRYRVTESWGKDVGVKVGSHVLDWKHLGRKYTWSIYDMRTGAVTATFTGTFVDKGWRTTEGKYESDAERAHAIGASEDSS